MHNLTLLDILILCLATFRAAQLVALDDGPGQIFARLRSWAIADARELFSCPYCLGVWFAALFTVAWLTGNPIVYYALVALAVSGGQAALQGMIDKG